VALSGSCKNRRFGGTCRFHLQGRKIRLTLFSIAHFSTLKMEATQSSETSVPTRSTRRHIPKDGILHTYRNENLKYRVVCSMFITRSHKPLELSSEVFASKFPSSHHLFSYIYFNIILQNFTVRWVTLLIHIREVLISKLSSETEHLQ
jgi:hypothetical protein